MPAINKRLHLKQPLKISARILCAAALAAGLTNCVPLAVGGAAVGGYQFAKDPRTAGQIASDSGITGTIKTRYLADKQINGFDINVDTHLGVVSLYGSVTSDQAKERAIGIARSVKGVQKIVSHLVVVPSAR